MDTFELFCFHPPPIRGKRRERWILAGLLALGVVALVACGESAATPITIAESCWEAIAAGDTEAALDLFIDGALVTDVQAIFDGKDRIRDWIDNGISFLRRGAECSEWSSVNETADNLDFHERCTIEQVLWEGHHTLHFENGKIRNWTMTFRRIE
jgi:hypothetical protein